MTSMCHGHIWPLSRPSGVVRSPAFWRIRMLETSRIKQATEILPFSSVSFFRSPLIVNVPLSTVTFTFSLLMSGSSALMTKASMVSIMSTFVPCLPMQLPPGFPTVAVPLIAHIAQLYPQILSMDPIVLLSWYTSIFKKVSVSHIDGQVFRPSRALVLQSRNLQIASIWHTLSYRI